MGFSKVFKHNCFFSFLSVIYVATRTWNENSNMYNACMGIFENKIYSFIFSYFIIMCTICAGILLDTYIVGPNNKTDIDSSTETISTIIIHMLFSLIFLREGSTSTDMMLLIVPITLRYLAISIHQRVLAFFTELHQASPSLHQNTFTLEIILFFVSLKSATSLLSSSSFRLVIMLNCLIATLEYLRTMVYHSLYLIDIENGGNSFFTYNGQTLSDILLSCLSCILTLCIYGKIGLNLRSYYIVAQTLIMIVPQLKQAGKRCKLWVRMLKEIESLPKPENIDLEKDDDCLVCRTEMTIDNSLKLPCGHILHKDCLFRWIGKNDTCPICRRSIVNMIDKKEESDGNEIFEYDSDDENYSTYDEEDNNDFFPNHIDDGFGEEEQQVDVVD